MAVSAHSIIYDLDVDRLKELKQSILDMLSDGECLHLTDYYMDVIAKIDRLIKLKQ